MKLITAGLPDANLAYTNFVFVHPVADALLPAGPKGVNYVAINGFRFLAKAHSGVAENAIAFNALQRNCIKASMNDALEVTHWRPEGLASDNLFSLRLQVDLLGKRRTQLKEEDLAEALPRVFGNHPMTKNQVFCMDYQGTALKFTVTGCQVPSEETEEGLTKYAPTALLTADTEISIEPNKANKRLELEKSQMNRRGPMFNPEWKFADMGIGGLDTEFSAIFRRSFASRLFPPKVIAQLGIKHVKGMLLYGPPGTGKTLIARQIGKLLAQREPKVVNGPEILNKYVGASEENIRKLFADAEEEYEEKGESSDLHIIIFDEIDAICKARGSSGGSTGVHDTIVNQMLSKIDGVNSPNNILVIGMTNRKDMIDPALLRPGRLEVHIEIGLPDEAGRVQILNIHTSKMKDSGLLGPDVKVDALAEMTKNFSGAEIEGLVKNAASYALYGSIDVTKQNTAGTMAGSQDVKDIKVTMADFEEAYAEMEPAFGVEEDVLQNCIRGGMIPWGSAFERLMYTLTTLREQVQTSDKTPLMSVLLSGPNGAGKTAMACKSALDSGFPFIKLVSPENFVGHNENSKAHAMRRIFEDAYKSPFSIIVLDNLERLLDYVPIGPRFSNTVLQTLLVLIKKVPPTEGRKLMIIATSSNASIMDDMNLRQAFNVILDVPELTMPDQVKEVVKGMPNINVEPAELDKIANGCAFPIAVKNLLMVIEMAVQKESHLQAEKFLECLDDCGLLKNKILYQ